MKDRNIAIILDPPHGIETAGKRSPDGRFREYKWGRERLWNIDPVLKDLGFEVYWTNTTENEIGLSNRVKVANSIKTDKQKILISLHNNAAGNGKQWLNATGIEIFTTKGWTKSDIMAGIMLDSFKMVFGLKHVKEKLNFSGINYRGLKEQNFTVLTGNTYLAMLIECMFMDNKEDLKLLENPYFNDEVERAILNGIIQMDNYFNE